jgi:hypothetical protein
MEAWTEDMRPFVDPLARAIDAAISQRASFNTYAECRSRPTITRVKRTPGADAHWSAAEAADPRGEQLKYWSFSRPGWGVSFQIAVNESNLVGFPLSGIADWKWESLGTPAINADINAFLRAHEVPSEHPFALLPARRLEEVALGETQVAPFTLDFQDSDGYWPFLAASGETLARPGIYQYLTVPGTPSSEITAKVCRFESEDAATAAMDYYVSKMAVPFREGGLRGLTVGHKCWTYEDPPLSTYIVFQRGPFCASFTGSWQDREVIATIARAQDDKIIAFLRPPPPTRSTPAQPPG